MFYRMFVVQWKTDRILHLLENPNGLETQRSNPERDLLLRSGRNIETLQAASGYHLVASPDENTLYCDVCVTNFTGELLKRVRLLEPLDIRSKSVPPSQPKTSCHPGTGR